MLLRPDPRIVAILIRGGLRLVVRLREWQSAAPWHEDAETSYHSHRTIITLDIAPDLAAFKNVQRIAARVNPKIGQVDVNEAINLSVVKTLEHSGYLAEARKKVALAR
jgi:hypothetical protein